MRLTKLRLVVLDLVLANVFDYIEAFLQFTGFIMMVLCFIFFIFFALDLDICWQY